MNCQSGQLDVSRLDCVRRRGEAVIAACPACREAGSDKTGDHLIIYPDGRYGCVIYRGDHGHRRRIWQIVGTTMRWATPSNRRTIASTQKLCPDLQIRKWQDLRPLRGEEIAVLASRYGITTKALNEAQKRGVLLAGEAGGSQTWVVTDSERHVRQDARLDGGAIMLKAGTVVPKRTLGSPAWLVGLDRSRQYDHWLIVEGNTDALAAFELLLRHNELPGWGVGILLGAGMARSLHPKAIEALRHRAVALGFDADTAGNAGAEALCAVLHGVARSINRVVLPVGRDLRDMLTA